MLIRALLEKFESKIGQNNVLMALSSLRQEKWEIIST